MIRYASRNATNPTMPTIAPGTNQQVTGAMGFWHPHRKDAIESVIRVRGCGPGMVGTIRRSRHATQAGGLLCVGRRPAWIRDDVRELEIGLPGVHMAPCWVVSVSVNDHHLLTQTPRREASSRACSAWVPGARVGDHRPGGRIFSSDPALACRRSRGPHATPPGAPWRLGLWHWRTG
jgi:hypothetical protein